MKKDTRNTIISIGMELISIHGYNSTGIDQILKQAGVPKGSFYHYFSSKEDFGLAVMASFAEQYAVKLDGYLLDETRGPLERIRQYLEEGLLHLEQNNFAKGCLIGNLGQEMADQNERFREELEKVFQSWQQRFTDCFREAQDQGALDESLDPAETARFLLSGWEGAILHAKISRSVVPLRSFIDMFFANLLRIQ